VNLQKVTLTDVEHALTSSSKPYQYVSLEATAVKNKYSIVDGPFGSSLKNSDFVEDGIPVLQGKNITGDSFRFFDIRYISREKAEELKRSKVVVGDVLLVKIGSIGYSAVITDLYNFPYAIIPANLAKVTIDEAVVNKKYLLHWLRTSDVKNYFTSVASKTAQPALSLTKIKELPVPLPPLSEQKRIAAILDKADEIRRKREAAIAKLDQLAQSIFVEMFGELESNSKQLPTTVLKDICLRVTDGTHQAPKWQNDGIPFLFISNIVNSEITLGNL
jgi:type I restriction enzyme S subunit